MEPSVKGFSVQPAIDRIRALVDQQIIKDLEAETNLTSTDLAMIEEGIGASLWYPVASLERMLYVLRDAHGRGRDEYLVQLANESANEILSAPSVSMILTGAKAFGDRAGTALVKIGGLAFSFGHWTYSGDGLRDFKIHVEEAAALTDPIVYNCQGFIEVLAARFQGEVVRCEWSRPTPDTLEFHGLSNSVRG